MSGNGDNPCDTAARIADNAMFNTGRVLTVFKFDEFIRVHS